MCSQACHVYTNHCKSSPEPPVSDSIYAQYYLHVIRKRPLCLSVMHKVSVLHGLDVTVENLSDDSCSYSAGIGKTTLIDTTGLFFLVFKSLMYNAQYFGCHILKYYRVYSFPPGLLKMTVIG